MGDEDQVFNMEDPPHLHIGFDKKELMLRTFLLLCIIALASVIIMGMDAFLHIIIALGVVLIVHGTIYSYQIWKGIEPTYKSHLSPLVAGMIVGLAMPIAGPFFVTALVALLMISVFKYGQARFFDRKYLNPAAVSKVILLLFLSLKSLDEGLLFHTHHLDLNLITTEGLQSSMWIFSNETLPIIGTELSAAQSLFLWQTHGWIGGASSLVVLIVGTIAAYWLRYKWRIIVSTLGTMTILAAATGFYLDGDPILRIAFHVFTGSVIFLAFFMATEPQSTPLTENSQYVFGISLAVLTFPLQLLNVLGASIIALVILNMATPYLDKIGIKTPYGHKGSKGGDDHNYK
ncbi:MAG: RnfABCDGE type electron transport complex subunit D [Thermoplasmatota archaeon]